MDNTYLNLTSEQVEDIYDSIPKDVLKTMHFRFSQHCYNARRDSKSMDLSREQWCAIWWNSDKWDKRGRESTDSFQMCRKDDLGGYSMGNVRIDTKLSNLIECGKAAKPFIATRTSTGEEFYCESQICEQVKQLGLKQGNVSSCLNGKLKQYKGFTFRYA